MTAADGSVRPDATRMSALSLSLSGATTVGDKFADWAAATNWFAGVRPGGVGAPATITPMSTATVAAREAPMTVGSIRRLGLRTAPLPCQCPGCCDRAVRSGRFIQRTMAHNGAERPLARGPCGL